MEHGYSKQQCGIAKIDRRPSFVIHSYAKLSADNCRTQSKKRQLSGDSGLHCSQPNKCYVIESSIGTGHTLSRWNVEEKKWLNQYVVKQDATERKTDKFWDVCAVKLREQFPAIPRTGDSCRRCYQRSFKEHQDIPTSNTLDKGCQTDLSFPQTFLKREEDKVTTEDAQHVELDGLSEGASSLLFLKKKRLENKPLPICTTTLMTELLNYLIDNNITSFLDTLVSVPLYKDRLWQHFLCEIGESAKMLTERRSSCLYHKDFKDLVNFSWDVVTSEYVQDNTYLTEALLAVVLPTSKMKNVDYVNGLVPKFGNIYSVLMSSRFNELSRVKRVLTLSLAHNHAHQKVYDHLQPLGVTLSHSRLVEVMDIVQGHFNSKLIEAVKSGKRYRIVGDNINFQVQVRHARKSSGKSSHMQHWFGSAAIIQNISFDKLCNVTPQCNLSELPFTNFLPLNDDYHLIKRDYVLLTGRVLVRFFPQLSFLSSVVKCDIKGEYTDLLTEKNQVIPLPAMAKNEQIYSDDVDILDEYEKLIREVSIKAGGQMVPVQIGGDQLTRERFSGAKRLRGCASTSSERFEHLTPITFELFHLQMALLKMFYQILYKTTSTETGSLHAAKIQLNRENADGKDVHNHYSDCFDLATSFIDTYIVEGVCHFFKIQDRHADLGQMVLSSNMDSLCDIEKQQWLQDVIGPFIDRMVLDESQSLFHHLKKSKPVSVSMPDGSSKTLYIHVPLQHSEVSISPSKDDHVGHYAHTVFEVGLLIKELADIIHVPDRSRLLASFKYMMPLFKGHNTKSKYALEILRFLMQQTGILSIKTAYESCYGLFVNTKGKANSHIPTDLQMEHIVRLNKSHIKAMCSNKTEKSVEKRSSAFYGMETIAGNYEQVSGVCTRAQRHKIPSPHDDELLLAEGLRRLNPFNPSVGRKFQSIPRLRNSPVCKLQPQPFISWITSHQSRLQTEIGK